MATYPTSGALDTKISTKKSAGGKAPYVVEQTFNLDTETGVTAKIANADVINLVAIPANHMVLAAKLETTVAQTGGTGTCTLQLRVATTAISAATNISAAAVGTSTTIAPVTTGTSATNINVLAAIGGGTVTVNPTITIRVLAIDMT